MNLQIFIDVLNIHIFDKTFNIHILNKILNIFWCSVERRRRFNINDRIKELGGLLPSQVYLLFFILLLFLLKYSCYYCSCY